MFDAGRGSRLVSLRRAEAEELAQSYVATVLAAVAEAEDALAGERLLAERSRLLAARLSAARDATAIARERYRDGTGTYLTLLDASRSEASAETAYLNVERITLVEPCRPDAGAWRCVEPCWDTRGGRHMTTGERQQEPEPDSRVFVAGTVQLAAVICVVGGTVAISNYLSANQPKRVQIETQSFTPARSDQPPLRPGRGRYRCRRQDR